MLHHTFKLVDQTNFIWLLAALLYDRHLVFTLVVHSFKALSIFLIAVAASFALQVSSSWGRFLIFEQSACRRVSDLLTHDVQA